MLIVLMLVIWLLLLWNSMLGKLIMWVFVSLCVCVVLVNCVGMFLCVFSLRLFLSILVVLLVRVSVIWLIRVLIVVMIVMLSISVVNMVSRLLVRNLWCSVCVV